jgi:hypothetical protein
VLEKEKERPRGAVRLEVARCVVREEEEEKIRPEGGGRFEGLLCSPGRGVMPRASIVEAGAVSVCNGRHNAVQRAFPLNRKVRRCEEDFVRRAVLP